MKQLHTMMFGIDTCEVTNILVYVEEFYDEKKGIYPILKL